MAGRMLSPATAFEGWVRYARMAGAPGLTVVEAVAVMAALTVSVAVTDWAPRFRKETLGAERPATKVVVAGSVAPGSLEVRLAVPVYPVATCSAASSARMLAVTGTPALAAGGSVIE